MKSLITTEILVAYSQCPRKAFELLIHKRQEEIPEYLKILLKKEKNNQEQYIKKLKKELGKIPKYSKNNFKMGYDFYHSANLIFDDLKASCAILSRVNSENIYEPYIFCGTHKVSKEKKLELIFIGYILGKIQGKIPKYGYIISLHKHYKIQLRASYKQLLPFLEDLRSWKVKAPTVKPSLLLTKHCDYCQYQSFCVQEAKATDHLSRLDRISTPKMLRKYESKGIFTVNQLSYLFKPRKTKTQKVSNTHRPELQALAIRNKKTYIQKLPELQIGSIEIFLDIEGIPDENTYYLIGLLVRKLEEEKFYSFWADDLKNEKIIWKNFITEIKKYPNELIYHYGNYDKKSIEILAKRYDTNIDFLNGRLCNITTYIYGKIYFPITSNRLKDIGKLLGASWSHPLSSGLQSLVWRHSWENTGLSKFKSLLIVYNREDCYALAVVVKELHRISESADILNEIDFADFPKKYSTNLGQKIHQEFEMFLQLAHEKYDRQKINFQEFRDKYQETQNNTRSWSKKGYQGQTKIRPKPTKIVKINPLKNCIICGHRMNKKKSFYVSRLIIDIIFSKNGVRKAVIEYQSERRYCESCKKWRNPQEIDKYGKTQLYGHTFKAWVVYLRVVHRLPYQKIADIAQDQFHVEVSSSYLPAYIREFGKFYAETNDLLTQQLLQSSFIHADETPINIRGETQYVWVFTDGYHVILKLRKTREAKVVHEFLDGYSGVLITDFYPGYDSIDCLQQKCWVHLIRDLNEDLWKAPFDSEFEQFVNAVNNMISPIIEAVYKYGLKKRNLAKFQNSIKGFFETTIDDKLYRSEIVKKYQKRFKRYKKSLFTFTEHDDVAWHNNTAERALRHISKQEQISGSFYEKMTHDYLTLLGIQQTCRFYKKRFFDFLLSEQKDLEFFRKSKRR